MAVTTILRNSCQKSQYLFVRALSASSIPRYEHELCRPQWGNAKDRSVLFLPRNFGPHTSGPWNSTLIVYPPRILEPFSKGFGGGVRTLATASVSATSTSTLEGSAAKAKSVIQILQHYGQCYWELSKARLSMLVVATSGAGFVLGSGASIDWAGLVWTCAGTMMVAASANSFNQIFEVNNDAKMKRTMRRPLPGGRLSIPSAVIWAASMGAAGSALLSCKVNALAAGLAASNLVLYALIYTPLKQIHPINTWVGAVVGAIPPLLGWAAATGNITLGGLVLPAVLYFWQIPHFMALAYLCRNDYAAGGFKMLSLLDGTGERTSLAALRNCIYLLPVGFVAYDLGITSAWFGLETALLTTGMGAAAVLFYFHRNAKTARRLFHASLLYLPLLMAGMLFHRLPNSQHERTTDLGERDNVTFQSVELLDCDESKDRYALNKRRIGNVSRPPVAYASAAPFPFLPVPTYISSDS
uniref:Heme O synthase n=1 Tax=Wollemia nobilis TaxID=56998 RepID=A0A0C9QNF9_9CONI